jgi:hypothetical protein
MDRLIAVLILYSGTPAVACYPAFKLVELNPYVPVLVSAFGDFVAADRLAVTEALRQENADTFGAPLPVRFNGMLTRPGLLSNIEHL